MNPVNEKTILVVDDEQDLREAIEMGLQVLGFRTLSAEGGQKALEVASKNEVDAVLSDMRMSEGDGIYLLENFTQRFPRIPVYIMTGFSAHSKEELLKLGAKGVLAKPFELDDLYAKLQEGLGKPTP